MNEILSGGDEWPYKLKRRRWPKKFGNHWPAGVQVYNLYSDDIGYSVDLCIVHLLYNKLLWKIQLNDELQTEYPIKIIIEYSQYTIEYGQYYAV